MVLSKLRSLFGASSKVDLAALCNINKPIVVGLLQNWENAEDFLFQNGVPDPAQVRYIIDMIPEIMADIAFAQSKEIGPLGDVLMVVLGDNRPDIHTSIRSTPLYKTIKSAKKSGDLPSEIVAELVGQSALADSASQALSAGDSLKGSVTASVFVGIKHDGEKLILDSK